MIYKKNKTQKLGFSLIELSIVLAVIGILMIATLKSSDLISQARISSAAQKTVNSPVLKIEGLSLWYETTLSNSFLSAESKNEGAISRWNDNSGNNPTSLNDENLNNARQDNFINRPNYIVDGVNGLPVLRFDGEDDFLSFDGTSLTNTNYTIFLVSSRNSNKNVNPIIGGTAITNFDNLNIGYFLNATSRFRISHYGDFTASNSGTDYIDYNGIAPNFLTYNNSISQIHSITSDSNIGKVYYQNGGINIITPSATAIGANAKLALSSFSESAIGRFTYADTTTFTAYFDGDIAEMIVFNKNLSDQERQDVERYLSDKYQITLSYS